MPEENLINDKAIQSATGHAPELPERSATETAAEAERTIADIDKVVVDFRAQEAVTNPDDVHELESIAQSSVAQVQEVLHTQEDLGLESTIKENTNTPEYKKAQDYAKQVQVKIANILQSISDDRLRGKAQFKLDKLSKSFWFFCKEMAFNDMEEFDYNSKISMMESNYQKVLVEIDAVSADFLAKDKKKVPNPEVSKVTPVENPVGATSDDQSIETVKQDESTVSAETDSQSVAVEPKNIDVVVEDNIQATDQGLNKFQELENLHRTMTQASSKTKFSLGKLNRKKRTIESTINSDVSQEMPLAVDNDFSYNQAQSWEALYLALSNKLGSAAEPIMDRLRLVELGDRSTPEELSKTEGMTPEIIAAVAGLRHKPFEESHEDFQYFENLYNYIERIVLPDRAKKIIKNIEAFRAGKISEEVLAAGLQPLYSGWVVPEIKNLLAKEAEGSTAFVVQTPAVPEQTPESVKSAEIESVSSEESNVLAPEIVDVPKNTPTQSTEPVNPEPKGVETANTSPETQKDEESIKQLESMMDEKMAVILPEVEVLRADFKAKGGNVYADKIKVLNGIMQGLEINLRFMIGDREYSLEQTKKYINNAFEELKIKLENLKKSTEYSEEEMDIEKLIREKTIDARNKIESIKADLKDDKDKLLIIRLLDSTLAELLSQTSDNYVILESDKHTFQEQKDFLDRIFSNFNEGIASLIERFGLTLPKGDSGVEQINKSGIPESLEKDLGYLDIDPKVIWEKMTPKDMEALQALMKAEDMVKINEFYQGKIKEVLVDQHREGSVNEDLEKQMAEAVNAIIQNKIEHDAASEALKSTWKDKGIVVKNIAKNIALMGGASLAIGALGVGTGGVGILAYAGGMTLVRIAMRKVEARRAKITPPSVLEKEKQEQAENIAKKKAEILATIFSPDNAEKLREELSGHISNVLRVQTSERALKSLREYEQADGVKEPEVAGAKLRAVEKELYLNALTRIRAEHPDATPEQQQNMALTLALTLGQHEKGENLAKQRLEAIKKSKPALYKLIENFNLLNAGSPDKKPAGMSQEDESTWDKYKYDLVSLGIGSAVGYGIRTVGPVRIAMGAVAGAGIGYKVGEWMEKRDEKKALAEIAKMIDESETKIRDIEFPTEEIEQLKKDSIFVKSKLDLGFLDSDPLLKSRAENFIHQVQKIELANQESFKKLLESVSSRTDKRAEQVEEDLNRIGSKIKNRRLWTTIGGAVLGGVAALWLDEHFNKKESDPDKIVDSKPGDATASTDSTLGVEQPRPPQVTGNPYFEDKIDSTNMSGTDSIWRSTHQIFEDHAKELGYKGDLNDQQALSAWAENQTANAVQHLNQDQGGNLADLVHDGDKVKIAFINGKPVLSFEASSGLEAGHLADSNVADLAARQKFGTGIDHNLVMDQSTGDQFLEIKSGSDIYRVYDWDRDAQPNVIFPDGHTQEMSVGDLNKLLAEKNILAVENAKIESTVDTVTATAPEVVAANITEQKVEDFINNGSDYTRDVYESAKNSGHMSDLVSSVVKGENPVQTGALISDYARDNGWSEDKIKIFLNAVRSGEKIDLSSGQFDTNDPDIILKNMEAFERSALDNFDKVKDMPAEHWIPARIGDQYFNIQKIHSGFWPARSDHWLIDTNGDFATDAIKLDDHAMRAAFSQDKIELTREALEKLSGKK